MLDLFYIIIIYQKALYLRENALNFMEGKGLGAFLAYLVTQRNLFMFVASCFLK